MQTPSMERRDAILGISGVLGGSIATKLLVESSEANTLELTDTSFSVSGGTHEYETELQDVNLSASIEYEYNANTSLDKRAIGLYAGPSESDLERVAIDVVNPETKSNSGTLDLQGSLIEETAYTLSELDNAETTIHAKIECWLEANNEEIARETATETFTLTVNEKEISVELAFQATGSTSIEETEG
jgi:hypothetical protein